MSGKAAAKKSATNNQATNPVRVDVLHTNHLGRLAREVHLTVPVEIDGCNSFKYSEREGRYGNALPEGATKAEIVAFALMMELKYVEGIDEVRPDGHAIELRFGRVQVPDEIMPKVLKIIFRHLGFKNVLLSFWTEAIGLYEWTRIPSPYALRIPGVKIAPLPEDIASSAEGGVYLQLCRGARQFTVQVAGGDIGELLASLGGTQMVTVVGVQRAWSTPDGVAELSAE